MNIFRKKTKAAADFVSPTVKRVCPRCQWFTEAGAGLCAWCGTDLILYADIHGAHRVEWTRRIFIFALWVGGGYLFFWRGALLDMPWMASVAALLLWAFGLWYYLGETRRLLRVALRHLPIVAEFVQKRLGWSVKAHYPQDELHRLYRLISEETEKAEQIEAAAAKDTTGALAEAESAGLEILRANLMTYYARAHELEVLQWLNQIQKRKFEEFADTSFEHRFGQIAALEEAGITLAQLETTETEETNLARRGGMLLLDKMRTAANRDNLSALLGSVKLAGEGEIPSYLELIENESLRGQFDEELYEPDDPLVFEAARLESLGDLLAGK